MLRKEVREWVKYLVYGKKSFKVIFANGQVEVVECKGYCWIMGNKAYNDEELVAKMVRFQNNEKKFIIKFEEIEEVNLEESLVEEVENLNDDLFQESDIAYAEEAIERETNGMTLKEFKKLTIAERKELVKVVENPTSDYINYICEKQFKILVNGKDYYDCYKSDCGANIFRYGKHQKQAHCDYQLDIETIQIVGVTC